jgi:hypothetical protein
LQKPKAQKWHGAVIPGVSRSSRHGCTSRKAASYNQFPCNTGPKGLMTAVGILRFLLCKNLKLKNGTGPQFLEFHEVKLRKVKRRSRLTRARDRSGIFGPEGQKLERIARFFAPRRKKCAQIPKQNTRLNVVRKETVI